MTDYEQMIISALRYALPRKSYIMSCTDDFITNMLKEKVSEAFIICCIKDIEDHYKEAERFKWNMQGTHDWKPLLNRLRDY